MIRIQLLVCIFSVVHVNTSTKYQPWIEDDWRVVLGTVLDHHFGSGAGSSTNNCQIRGPQCQYTRTINSWTVWWYTPNLSDLGRLSAGCPAGPSIDSYNAQVFAVCSWYLIKIMFSTTNNTCLHVLQFALLINSQSVFYPWDIVFFTIKVVNNSTMSMKIRAMPWLPNM